MPSKKEKFTLPLLITKAFTVFPSKKDVAIDAGRDFSIKAINASRDNNSSLILVVTQKSANVEVPTQQDLFSVGTLCRITSYSDMKTYVRVRILGTARVKINNVSFDASGYFVADSEKLEDELGDERKIISLTKQIITSLQNIPQITSSIPRTALVELTTKGAEPSELADFLAPYLPLTAETRQALLEETNIERRLTIILAAINEAVEEQKIDSEIAKDVAQTTEKQQRD